ncbi:MAG: GNAT family N-acetyltransferase [Parvibaculum sp.]|jgi:CelD/BcsL family acetyltransferase involved in cellulose biosynthesis|nr:GNAT family N-acetyltransferase [Parvibaculum sp.]
MSVSSEDFTMVPEAGRTPRPRGISARFRAGYEARLAHAAGITIYETFEAAEPVWRAFEERARGTAFQSFDWLSIWHAHVGATEGIEPAIAVVARQGETLLLAPLGIERKLGLRRLVWLGGRLADYKGPLVAPEFEAQVPPSEFPALWKQIRRALPQHDLVLLENQPVSLGTPETPFGNPFAALGGDEAPDAAWVFELPGDFDTFTKRYRAETRRADRSKLKKLEAEGEVTFRFAATPEERLAMVEETLARKAAQLAAQGIASIFSDERYLDAFRALALLPEERKLIEAAELRIDGMFLSGSIGHLKNGRATLMVHTYDAEKFPRLSPGRLHLLKLIQSSIERGVGLYDLSVGYAAYKESFCEAPTEMRNLVAGASPIGAPAAFAIRQGLALKRFVKNEPRLMAAFQALREGFAKK